MSGLVTCSEVSPDLRETDGLLSVLAGGGPSAGAVGARAILLGRGAGLGGRVLSVLIA